MFSGDIEASAIEWHNRARGLRNIFEELQNECGK